VRGLIGAFAATAITLVFLLCFIGALHAPGPRSVPIGYVGSSTTASALERVLDRSDPGAYHVIAYPSATAARDAILNSHIDAALVPSAPVLLVATAAGDAVTNATVRTFTTAARSAGVNLSALDVRALHNSDPQGLAQTFFVVALLAPSLLFGYLLVTRFARRLNALLQLAVIAVYAAIVAAVATAFADAWIGALTGAPWGLFGIGTLLAFTAAVVSAAATRWAGRIGAAVIALLFLAVGIPASGVILGSNMITQWYADLGRALPAGAALPSVRNTIYFRGNAIAWPLLILSAWALAGIIALALVRVFRRRPLGEPASLALADHAAAEPSESDVLGADARTGAEASREPGRTPTTRHD
jgi:hypothetical protein